MSFLGNIAKWAERKESMNISGLSVFDAYFQQKYVSANTSATEKSDVFSQIEAVSPVNESEDSSHEY